MMFVYEIVTLVACGLNIIFQLANVVKKQKSTKMIRPFRIFISLNSISLSIALQDLKNSKELEALWGELAKLKLQLSH